MQIKAEFEISYESSFRLLKQLFPRVGGWLLIEWRWLRLVAAVSFLAAVEVQHANLPTKLIAIYFTIAIVTRLEASWSFGLALFMLIVIPVMRLLNHPGAAGEYALYTFYFICVGVLTSIGKMAESKIQLDDAHQLDEEGEAGSASWG